MALPTQNDLLTLDISYMGAPFVRVATKPDINLNTLDISYMGTPFWSVFPSYNLLINNSSHYQSSENITLLLRYLLNISNTSHLQVSDNLVIAKHVALIISDSMQNQESENLIFAIYLLIFSRKDYDISGIYEKEFNIARKTFNPVRTRGRFTIK